MTAKHTASPAPKGDVENNVNIAQKSEEIDTFDKKMVMRENLETGNRPPSPKEPSPVSL